jgi:bacillithiol system protein YtxJ
MNSWNIITTEENVDAIVAASENKPQVIFKHSITCGISAHAKERIVDNFDLIEDAVDFHYLDLLAYRSVSNYIAQSLKVTHQSPQIIIVQDGKVVFTDSHHSIQVHKMVKALS